jgi:NAD-dependent DNA ligase
MREFDARVKRMLASELSNISTPKFSYDCELKIDGFYSWS